MGQAKVVELSFDGDVIRETRLEGMAMPRLLLDDDHALGISPGPNGMQLGTIDLQDGSMQALLAQDSFLESLRSNSATPGQVNIPAVGTWAGGIVLGDKSTYRLALYDHSGRLLRVVQHDVAAPAMTSTRVEDEIRSLQDNPATRRRSEADWNRLRSEMLAREMPHFTHTNPLFGDPQGRIWVLGPAGDSAFADVFNAERHLGRLGLPCPGFQGSWALQGAWLAMVCQAEANEPDLDAVVKLFRIAG